MNCGKIELESKPHSLIRSPVLKPTSHVSLILGFYDIRIGLLSPLRLAPLYSFKPSFFETGARKRGC